jgi:hypothetical protein
MARDLRRRECQRHTGDQLTHALNGAAGRNGVERIAVEHCDFVGLCTSTSGELPVTVNVSASAPTFSSIFTVIVKFEEFEPSRLMDENPSREKVIT